jgi:hypothetical protein
MVCPGIVVSTGHEGDSGRRCGRLHNRIPERKHVEGVKAQLMGARTKAKGDSVRGEKSHGPVLI